MSYVFIIHPFVFHCFPILLSFTDWFDSGVICSIFFFSFYYKAYVGKQTSGYLHLRYQKLIQNACWIWRQIQIYKQIIRKYAADRKQYQNANQIRTLRRIHVFVCCAWIGNEFHAQIIGHELNSNDFTHHVI